MKDLHLNLLSKTWFRLASWDLNQVTNTPLNLSKRQPWNFCLFHPPKGPCSGLVYSLLECAVTVGWTESWNLCMSCLGVSEDAHRPLNCPPIPGLDSRHEVHLIEPWTSSPLPNYDILFQEGPKKKGLWVQLRPATGTDALSTRGRMENN